MRFDEIELDAVPLGGVAPTQVSQQDAAGIAEAPRARRAAALMTDLSLFAALGLALWPLLPVPGDRLAVTALAGFVVIVSFYYFVGCWMLWGRTIGGAIFEVRVVAGELEPIPMKAAVIRWGSLYLSIATCGLGFLMAALPARRSLPDRLSNSRCIAAG